jgi:hypothetical protein
MQVENLLVALFRQLLDELDPPLQSRQAIDGVRLKGVGGPPLRVGALDQRGQRGRVLAQSGEGLVALFPVTSVAQVRRAAAFRARGCRSSARLAAIGSVRRYILIGHFMLFDERHLENLGLRG